eukprot:GDKI01042365.1.p1 GENE.GDKI01042365.1~~GDKI01042365.1.p1  ORF type:complete len:510 (-),score=149.29 GDKI01042365.1:238-1767(-)
MSANDQQHVFKFRPELSAEQQKALEEEFKSVNVSELNEAFQRVTSGASSYGDGWELAPPRVLDYKTSKEPALTPCCLARTSEVPSEQLSAWRQRGMQMIREGKVAAVVMAGGAGTRFGFDRSKGCLPIGPVSNKPIFQLFAERILRLKELCVSGGGKSAKDVHLPLYVMTSPLNHEDTAGFFKEHNYFGLGENGVRFFAQQVIPAFDMQGNFLLDSKGGLSMSPNGNGNIFQALHDTGMLKEMQSAGIEGMHVFSVDNILCKVTDPLFVGYCSAVNAEVGNKCVEKTSPAEKVGVMCVKKEPWGGKGEAPVEWRESAERDRAFVVEYSELTDYAKNAQLPDGKLLWSAGNIANHYFRVDFVHRVVENRFMNVMYHKAVKKVPYVDINTGERITPTTENAIKLEQFIFDCFPFANRVAGLEVDRLSEFAPVKNPTGTDSPATAVCMMGKLHQKWVESVGGAFAGGVCASEEKDKRFEISPLVSYEGEGLEEYVSQLKDLQLPYHLEKHRN